MAVPLKVLSKESLTYFLEWADKIYVVGEPALLEKIPMKFRGKIKHFNIGPDAWGVPTHPELRTILQLLLAREES